MKLHTWIVLGMIVGVTFGYLVGPDSPILDGEIVVLHKGRAPALHEAIDAPPIDPPTRSLQCLVTGQEDGWTELSVIGSRQDRTIYTSTGTLPRERYSSAGIKVLDVVTLIGDIFLRLLKMLVVPLVIVSLSAGVASLGDPRKLGKMGISTLGYFFVTTAVAVTIGFVVALALQPGNAMPEEDRSRLAGPQGVEINTDDMPGFSERILDMIPENPLRALAEGNMLQVIFFAVMLGAALCLLAADKALPMVKLLDAATNAMVRMVYMVMVVAPIGVAAMMATVTASSGISVLMSLAAYAGVVILGLFLHVALCYTPAVRFLAGVPIKRFFKAARPAQLLTFGTSSSSAALPVTMECSKKGLGISRHVTTFVLPVGSTVNMDGTALYQGVATVFVAQLYGLNLGPEQLVQVVLMATLASVGAAGVPGAGMVTLTMVLTSLGLPIDGVAIIMGVDRILDMFRSAVNVTGDLSCTAFVARIHGERPGSKPIPDNYSPGEKQDEPAPSEAKEQDEPAPPEVEEQDEPDGETGPGDPGEASPKD